MIRGDGVTRMGERTICFFYGIRSQKFRKRKRYVGNGKQVVERILGAQGIFDGCFFSEFVGVSTPIPTLVDDENEAFIAVNISVIVINYGRLGSAHHGVPSVDVKHQTVSRLHGGIGLKHCLFSVGIADFTGTVFRGKHRNAIVVGVRSDSQKTVGHDGSIGPGVVGGIDAAGPSPVGTDGALSTEKNLAKKYMPSTKKRIGRVYIRLGFMKSS